MASRCECRGEDWHRRTRNIEKAREFLGRWVLPVREAALCFRDHHGKRPARQHCRRFIRRPSVFRVAAGVYTRVPTTYNQQLTTHKKKALPRSGELVRD